MLPTANQLQGLHIEPTNLCTLKCAGCARTRFIGQWPQHWKNHSIDVDTLFEFLDIDLTDKKITLCGNYGDPIYHPDLFKLISGLKQKGAHICIVTNGSYRKTTWWQELCNLLDNKDQVCFSIDGLPENFTQYRVNADWESIKTGIHACVASRAQTIWKYIVFNYNQYDIETARQLSLNLGIDIFRIDYSNRFDEVTNHLKPAESLIGNRYQSQATFKNTKTEFDVVPQCYTHREHYISAEGFYMPCCYVGDHRFYYKTTFGKDKKNYSINDHTLSQILATPATIQFYDNLKSHSVCQFNCHSTL
jgi:MoaA/NifB/PqqE/SkfB family radical SAM enzyme